MANPPMLPAYYPALLRQQSKQPRGLSVALVNLKGGRNLNTLQSFIEGESIMHHSKRILQISKF